MSEQDRGTLHRSIRDGGTYGRMGQLISEVVSDARQRWRGLGWCDRCASRQMQLFMRAVWERAGAPSAPAADLVAERELARRFLAGEEDIATWDDMPSAGAFFVAMSEWDQS